MYENPACACRSGSLLCGRYLLEGHAPSCPRRFPFRDEPWQGYDLEGVVLGDRAEGGGHLQAADVWRAGGSLLTETHHRDMVIHMKTTLTISDVTMREIKREAARRQQTMSELVEAALRAIVEPEQRYVELPPLPAFRGGGLRVNVANRDALYNVMEG